MEQGPTIPCGISVAAWGCYPWLRAAFSTRQGGVSTVYGPGELNLGWTAEDDAANVAENRRRFTAALPGRAGTTAFAEIVTLKQVHGAVAHVVRRAEPGAPQLSVVGDGLITAEPGLPLGILTADCVPVLIADTRLRIVAAFHAGWRGTLAGIVAEGVIQMQRACGCRVEDLTAAIGPCIRPCCFAVGEEVRAQFSERFGYASTLFEQRETDSGVQTFADLQAANRQQLLDAGVAEEAIHVAAACTACTRTANGERRFFSYRAERGRTGRMMNAIAVVEG